MAPETADVHRRFASVVDMVRDLADADFVRVLEALLASRQFVKSLIASRIVRGLTQAEVASRCGLKECDVSRIESSTDAELLLDEVDRYRMALA